MAYMRLASDKMRATMLPFSKRRAAGEDPGGRKQSIRDSLIRDALRLVDSGKPAAKVARDLGVSRATFYRRSRGVAKLTNLPIRHKRVLSLGEVVG